MNAFIKVIFFVFILVGISIALFISSSIQTLLTNATTVVGVWGYVLFVPVLATAVVAMTITVMTLIPIASTTFGTFATALLSNVGWTLGSLIAFFIARHLGRHFVYRFISLDSIDIITEKINTRSSLGLLSSYV